VSARACAPHQPYNEPPNRFVDIQENFEGETQTENFIKLLTSCALLVAAQQYDTDINKEYVIRGNAAILKCVLPSYLSDYLEIISWKIDDEEMSYNDKSYGSLSSTNGASSSHPSMSFHYDSLSLKRGNFSIIFQLASG
jgi:hypothetical protein